MSYTVTSNPKTAPIQQQKNAGAAKEPNQPTLTAEQLKRMEENRQKALKLKQMNSAKAADPVNSAPKIMTLNQLNSASEPAKNPVAKPPSSAGTASTPAAPTPSTLSDPLNGKCVPLADDPENRFEVVIGFNKALIDIFKTMSTRKYDPNTKRWNFAIKQYDDLVVRVKHELKNTVKLEPLDRNPKNRTIAKFVLCDRARFEVYADYNMQLQEIFKTMKTKSYDAANRRWSFSLSEYEKLIKDIGNTKFDSVAVSVIPLPKVVRDVFKDIIAGVPLKSQRFEQLDYDHLKSKLDFDLLKSLLPFQIECISFAVSLQGRLLLADDMGLGKTIQGLGIADYYHDEWPLFIISPSSVKFMWKESAKRWLSNTIRSLANLPKGADVDDYIQVIENGRQQIEKTSKIVICSYDLLAKNVDEIAQSNYNVVIADESHLLKNGKAARTKSVLKLIQNTKRVILLSGTPALSRPAELYYQIHAINPNLFGSFYEFGDRYCDGKDTAFGKDYSGFSNMKELRLILEEKLLIRREKKDVMQQLPSKVREMIILDPDMVMLNSKSLKQASKQMENQHLKGLEKRGALLTYFQETSKAKVKAVGEYITDMLERGDKFIVFAHHQSMLDQLQALCDEHKYDYIRIDGATNSQTRQVYVDKFQNQEKCRCALLSITAASTGITLTQSSIVVFAELYWNPGILIQAEDRAYRIGQKNSVTVQYLCAKGTADDHIWPLVNEKLNVLSSVGLTREDLNSAGKIDKTAAASGLVDIKQAFEDLIEVEAVEKSDETVKEAVKEVKKVQPLVPSKETTPPDPKSTKQAQINELLYGIDLESFTDTPPPKRNKL